MQNNNQNDETNRIGAFGPCDLLHSRSEFSLGEKKFHIVIEPCKSLLLNGAPDWLAGLNYAEWVAHGIIKYLPGNSIIRIPVKMH